MTEEEYQKLTGQHTTAFVEKCIEVLNNYKLSSGKRYKSDYHTILNWVIERVSKDYPQLDKPPAQSSAYDVNVNPFDQFVANILETTQALTDKRQLEKLVDILSSYSYSTPESVFLSLKI